MKKIRTTDFPAGDGLGVSSQPANESDACRLRAQRLPMVGKGRSGYVATCVDRASRYLVARKLETCSAKQVKQGLHDAMRRLPRQKRKTLTVDNGREFACHKDLTRLLGLAVYFAHPYSAWERGTNENTNGLLRQYLPKAQSFSQLTDCEVLYKRRTLGWRVYCRRVGNTSCRTVFAGRPADW